MEQASSALLSKSKSGMIPKSRCWLVNDNRPTYPSPTPRRTDPVCPSHPFLVLSYSSENRIRKTNRYSLLLRVVRQGGLAQFTSDTALLVATKGQHMIQHVVLVHPYRAGLEPVRNPYSRVQAFGVNGCGEAVGGHVAQADRVGFVFEFSNGTYGAENFLFHNLHVFAHVGEYGGLDEVTLVTVAFAADFDLGAFFFAGVDVSV